MNKLKLKQLNQTGSVLLIFVLVLPFLILIVMYYMSLSLTSAQVARLDQLRTEAQLAADAGADYAVEQFSQNNSWSSTGGEVTLHQDSSLKTTYTASLSGDSNTKTIAVTGKTYFPANSTTPRRTVSIFVDLRPVTSGTFSVISGAGGLDMSNNSKIVGGDVFINGDINLSNSAQIGLSTSPVTVEVADQICPNPANSTYPRVCNSGENGQPITINNSAHIYGTVKATNQASSNGMSNTGLVSGATVSPQPLPSYDRNAQKAAVATTITGSNASCSGSQTKTWAANTKITGDVSLKNQCKITVQGNVWITGKLDVSNSSQLIVADSLGGTRPVIMVDASAGAHFSNSATLASNSSGTGFEIITYYSQSSCSPDCSSVTGTNLANSRDIETIGLDNNASAPNTIFYSYWSKLRISNSGQIGAVIGQTVELSNAGTITFGTSTGTGGPTVWVVKGYRKQ